jgi:hypothetical protein
MTNKILRKSWFCDTWVIERCCTVILLLNDDDGMVIDDGSLILPARGRLTVELPLDKGQYSASWRRDMILSVKDRKVVGSFSICCKSLSRPTWSFRIHVTSPVEGNRRILEDEDWNFASCEGSEENVMK